MFNVINKVILEAELRGAPEMSFVNEAAKRDFEKTELENSSNACYPIIVFAKNWARLMEKQINSGAKLNKESMHRCERIADGIIGNSNESYLWAKTLLEDDWKYGCLLKDY